MSKQNRITINGQEYDAKTGLPVATEHASTAPKSTSATKQPSKQPATSRATYDHKVMHNTTPQKSATLVRKVTTKPTNLATPRQQLARPVSKPRTMDISRSSSISKFAAHPKPAQPVAQVPDTPAAPHPTVVRAEKQRQEQRTRQAELQKLQQPRPEAIKPSQVLKQEAISKALATPSKPAPKKRSFFARHPRLLSGFSAGFAVLLLAGYLTYLNMPSLSVRIASAQAGVTASYPQYKPDGYSLHGPVAFSDGEVTLKFAANTGSTRFDIKQQKSSWDSTAVREEIAKKTNGQFITSQERGLTIYSYNGNASWVNGGIRYSIEGDAPLSGEQIRRIATSL